MQLLLNIYKNKNEIEKSYTAETYDLMFGTMEDILNIIDIEKFDSGKQEDFVAAASKLIAGGLGQLKPLLLDVFDGLTEDELRKTRVKDLTKIVIEIVKYSILQIKGASTGKNA